MIVRSKRVRIAVVLTSVASLLVLAGSVAPTALGAPKNQLRFVEGRQPQDAEVGATIRASDLNDAAALVQVELVDAAGARVATSKGPVSFRLATDAGYASGSLSVTPQPLVNGLATFGEGTLSIGTANEPMFTDYALVPFTTKGTLITGPASVGFDIWEDGESCGSGETCDAVLRGDAPGEGADTYSLFTPGTLGASELPQTALPGLSCAGQRTVFEDSVFVNATTDSTTPDTPGPVFLTSHITQADFRAAGPSFGQAHVAWCVGLKTSAPWVTNGASFTQQDTNGDGTPDLYVGLAPKCPSQSPELSAPCIVSTTSDGAGGSTSVGWLPGGDPPRRT